MDDSNNKSNLVIIFLSSLFYQQKWIIFIDSITYRDIFYIDKNNKKEVNFMKHSYHSDNYYDYEKYVSFYDYYSNKLLN